MKEYITKAKVIEAIEKAVAPEITTIGDYETIGVFTRESIEQIVSNLPAADVVEVRHAFWSDYGSGVCCTNCGVSLFHQDENNNWGIEPSKFMFCPSCGARMDKEDDKQ